MGGPSTTSDRLRGRLWAKATLAYRTVCACSNWPQVLLTYGLGKMAPGSPAELPAKELDFRFRDGTWITCLRDAGSASPVFEVLVDDGYRIESLTRLLPQPVSVVHVGAHVGSATLRFARAWPDAAFVCVEPSPTSRRLLERNLSRNHVRATIVPAAVVGSTDRAVFFREPTPGSCESHVAEQQPRYEPNERPVKVSAVTMDELLAGSAGSVILKLDCKGSEYDIVDRTPVSAWASVLAIVMEYHPVPSRRFEELASQLERAGFRLARREPDHRSSNLGLAWFLQPHLGLDFIA